MSEIRILPPVSKFNDILGNLFNNLRRLPSCEHSDKAMQKSLTWVIEAAYNQARGLLEVKYKPEFPINPETRGQYQQYVDNTTYLRDRFNHFRQLVGIDIFKTCREGRYAPGGSRYDAERAIISKNTV